MEENKTKIAVKKVEAAIKKFDKKAFKVMFFVVDSKGTPIGSLSYTYQLAYRLKELGYKVQMLHAEKEFVGVGEWLGEKYAKLPHLNIEKDNVDVSPADFLFIPEIFSNVMSQTKSLPCKRIAILENFNYLTETIPMGVSWDDLQIRDCITTSEKLKKRLNEVFPYVRTGVISPVIGEEFTKEDNEPKKLIINIVSKNQSDTNAIIKPFYWKYPMYSWVAFRPINNLPKEEFAKALREGFATIWCDPFTDFGLSAIEAMACNNIVIGKMPENEPEWLVSENGKVKDNGVWYYNSKDSQEIIANVISSFLYNSIPSEIYEEMAQTVKKYSQKSQDKQIEDVLVKLFDERKKELEGVLAILNKKAEKE